MMKSWLMCCAAGALIVAPGCSSVYSSTRLAAGGPDTNGLTYALPTTWLEISSSALPDGDVDIEVNSLTLPDAAHVYSLDHVTSNFASDELSIEVDANQLLKKIDTKTEDVSDQIIIAAAKTISGLANFSLQAAPYTTKSERGCAEPDAPPWRVILNPTDPSTWPHWLNAGCLALTPIAEPGGAAPAAGQKDDEDCSKGVCHRAPIPHRADLDLGRAGRYQFVVGLLNNAPILSLNIERDLFISKKVDLTFTGGVLTKMEIERPSPFLEAASLPVDVAKGILSAPAEIFRLRVDYSSAAGSELDAQRQLLEKQREFDEFLEEHSQKDEADAGGE